MPCALNDYDHPNELLDGTGHFGSFSRVRADSGGDPDECGDLEFNDRVRTVSAVFSSGEDPADNPYKFWWVRGRNRYTGATDSVWEAWQAKVGQDTIVETGALAMPLDADWDGVGSLLILYNDSLAVNDSAFLYGVGTYAPSGNIQYQLQHWRHIDAPLLDSVRKTGALIVTVWWRNRHQERSFDSTLVFRDGAPLPPVGPSDTVLVDTVPDEGTYVYRLKHFTVAVIAGGLSGGLAYPNSAASSAETVVVDIPDPLTMHIDSTDLIMEDDWYTWWAHTSGGTPAYGPHRWEYQPFGGSTWTQVGTDSTYTRYVRTTDDWFWLRAAVWDSGAPKDSVVNRKLAVETWGGGGAGAAPLVATGGVGVRLRDGTCSPRPPVGDPARQPWLQMIMTSVRRIEYCRVGLEAS